MVARLPAPTSAPIAAFPPRGRWLRRAVAAAAVLALSATAAASPRAGVATMDDAQRAAQRHPRHGGGHHGGRHHGGRHHGQGDPALRDVPAPSSDPAPPGDPASPPPRPGPRDPHDPLIPLPF